MKSNLLGTLNKWWYCACTKAGGFGLISNSHNKVLLDHSLHGGTSPYSLGQTEDRMLSLFRTLTYGECGETHA